MCLLKAMCSNCLYDNKQKGVCVFGSLTPDNLPRKVKVTAVKHRLGCKLGLCSYTHLVTFYFKNTRAVSDEDGRCSWTSHVASVNMDKLLRHRLDDTAKISITWRRGYPRKFRPVYLPMSTLIEELTLENPPVFTIWFGPKPP